MVISLGNIKICESLFVLDLFVVDGVNFIFVKGVSNVVMNEFVIIQMLFSIKFYLYNFIYWELVLDFNYVIMLFLLVIELCFVGIYSINRDSSEGFSIMNSV